MDNLCLPKCQFIAAFCRIHFNIVIDQALSAQHFSFYFFLSVAGTILIIISQGRFPLATNKQRNGLDFFPSWIIRTAGPKKN